MKRILPILCLLFSVHRAFAWEHMAADGAIDRMETVPPKNYEELQLPRVKQQLEKAAVHLAQLLNSIRYK